MVRSPAHRSDPAEPSPVDPADISAQALRLHALGLSMTATSGRDGLIGRSDAELLAERCGALVSELVEAGLWLETDVSYVIRAEALLRIDHHASPPAAPGG